MTAELDEITINYEENGQLLVKELDKAILNKGAWTTILFRYQEYERAAGDFGPEKYSIRRYQKREGQYLAKSKFNISSPEQAKKIIETLSRWIENPISDSCVAEGVRSKKASEA